MGLFRKKKKSVFDRIQKSKVNSVGESLQNLDENGELPFGWAVHNTEFIKKIEDMEHVCLTACNDAKTDEEKRNAYLSLLKFIEDAEIYSAKCGECHLKYFKNMYTENPNFMKCVEKNKS